MDEAVLVAVEHRFDDLLEEHFSLFFHEATLLLHVRQQFTSLEEFHYNSDLHVGQRQTVDNPHDVIVVQPLQDLSLHEDVIDVCSRTDHLRFDGLDSDLLSCDAVLRKNDFSKAALAQLLEHVILTEAAARVEIISLRSVQGGLVLDVLEVVVGELTSLGVEQSQLAVPNLPTDVGDQYLLAAEFELQQ